MSTFASPDRFVLHEATVASIHAAFASGGLSCVALVEAWLERIEA